MKQSSLVCSACTDQPANMDRISVDTGKSGVSG